MADLADMALALVAALVWAGLLCGSWGLSPTVAAGVGLAASVGAVAAQRRTSALWMVPLCVAAFVWPTLLAAHVEAPRSAAAAGIARLNLEVKRSFCGTRGCWTEARVIRCSPIGPAVCATSGARIGVSSESELPLWSDVALIARLNTVPELRNRGPHPAWFDVRPALRAVVQREVPVKVTRASWLGGAITRARGAARQALSDTLAEPHAGIARALLLGEGSAVDRELDTAIRNAGVSHVLAVSGLHITVLAGALVAVVRLLWLWSPGAPHLPARRVAGAMGVALAPLVACLCGGAPSAWRAAWTSTLMFALEALGMKPCALRVSCFAIAAYAVAEPRAAVHPGFVLSVVATVALLTAPRAGEGLVAAFRESLRAWMATTPFLVWSFGTTSLVSLLANVALLPLGSLLIPIAVAHLCASLFELTYLLPTAALLETSSGAFVSASRYFAALDPGVAVPPLTPVQGVALASCAGAWLVRTSLRARLWVSLACLVAAGGSELALRRELARNELRVTFLDVGQGDGALLQLGTGQTALIDAGGAVQGGPDPGAMAVVPLLRALRVRELDLVVLTHPHPDHYGGLRAVLDAVRVRELWDGGQAEAEGPEGAASQLLALARRRGTRVRGPRELCAGPTRLGALSLDVLAPCPGYDEDWSPNDNSLVVRAQHGRRAFLFTGDVEREAEAKLVARSPARLHADVLKVPHHGSRTSSSDAFVKAVHPWLAVISAGLANRFGHPHLEVRARLSRHIEHVLRTDQVGSVRVLSDGERLEVDAWDRNIALVSPP